MVVSGVLRRSHTAQFPHKIRYPSLIPHTPLRIMGRMKPKMIPPLTDKQIESFWLRVDKRSPDECWPWLSYLDVVGYGGFRMTQNGQYYKPHRVAYTLAIGPIPEGLTIDHVKSRGCTLKSCCNPAHLEAVTQGENVLRWLRPRMLSTCRCGKPRRKPKDSRCSDCYNAYMRDYQAKRKSL